MDKVYIIGRDTVPESIRLAGGESMRITLFVPEGTDCALDLTVDLDGPGAIHTDAAQESRTLLLSDAATAEARPQLEIYADDVKCSHGATTGYLNPEELFYMRSRGIPEAEARAMQIEAFLAPILNRLP